MFNNFKKKMLILLDFDFLNLVTWFNAPLTWDLHFLLLNLVDKLSAVNTNNQFFHLNNFNKLWDKVIFFRIKAYVYTLV